MSKIKHWISAFRFRTLLLAVAGVVLGTGLAIHTGTFSLSTALLALLLAISIQILSNLSNDLGDFQKGTDTTGKRQGPTRALQGGNITPKEMKTGIIINIVFVAIVGLTLVFTSIKNLNDISTYILLGIGAVSILSAILYTLGKHAYGYSGWGDFFAFLFFGPVAVVGTYFLHTNVFSIPPIFPAIGLGLVSTMILNVNNMRDIENDIESRKITVASKMGLNNAKIYHLIMTLALFASFIIYSIAFASHPWYRYSYIIVFVFQLNIMRNIWKERDHKLDPYLKQTALAGLALAILFSLSINL